MGDTVSVVVPVHELGGVPIEAVDVALRLLPEEGPPTEAQRRTVAVAPGGVTPVVFGWTIEHRAGDLEVVVDPDGALPELREENNRAVRPLFADLPYRTQGYTYDRLLLVGTEPNTRYEVRDAVGGLLARGELGRDESVDVADLGAGQVVTAAADRPFVAAMGEVYLATGMHVRDASGTGLSRRHVTPTPRSTIAAKGDVEELDRLVLYAPEATDVVVSDLDDGTVLAELSLATGALAAVDPQAHPERLVRRTLVEADAHTFKADVWFLREGQVVARMLGLEGSSSAELNRVGGDRG